MIFGSRFVGSYGIKLGINFIGNSLLTNCGHIVAHSLILECCPKAIFESWKRLKLVADDAIVLYNEGETAKGKG